MFDDGGFDALFGGGGSSIPNISSGPAVSKASASQSTSFGSDFNVNSGANSFERILQMALPLIIVGGALWLFLKR